jgi:DNA-binding IclR family transcriptional regulator
MKMEPVNTPSTRSPPSGSSAGVGLLRKAFQILDLFTDERASWTQSELARTMGLPRSTLSRVVRFLCSRGYLFEQRGRYSLGYAAISLGRRARDHFNLVDLCADLLEELAQATSETVILTGYDAARASVVCLAQIPSRRGGLRVFENMGTAYPLHSGATAKVVLAFLAKAQISAVLAGDISPLNPSHKITPQSLRAHLDLIREAGYAVTREETYPGVIGIAVPILTARREPLGSIAVAAPLHRIPDEAIAGHASRLGEIAKRITLRMGGAA